MPEEPGAAKVGDSLPTYFIDEADISVEQGHRLVIRLAPSEVPPGFWSDSGMVNVLIHASTDEKAWYTSLSSQAVTTPTTLARVARVRAESARWVDPEDLRVVDEVTSGPELRFARRTATVSRAGALADEVDALGGPVFLSPDDRREGGWDGGVMEPRAMSARCPHGGEGPHQTRTLPRKRVWATVGTSYPVGKSKAWMTVGSGSANSTTYGGALKFPGVHAALSGTRSIDGGWTKIWNPSGVKRSYRKEIEYRRVESYNYLAGPACDHVHWIPAGETGGTASNTKGINRPKWKKCVEALPGPFIRNHADGNNYDYGAGVKLKDVLGIDLGVSRKYSRTQSLTYDIVGKNKMLCGNNDWPSRAGKVMERYR